MRPLRRTIGSLLSAVFLFSSTSCIVGNASAIEQPDDPRSSTTIDVEWDGTGHGTPDGTFVNTQNGFVPGDDAPDDGVVSSGDTVGYAFKSTFYAGPERKVRQKFIIPEGLKFDSNKNKSVCDGSKIIESKRVYEDDENQKEVICEYDIKRGVPATVDSKIVLDAEDSRGQVKENQIVSVETYLAGSSPASVSHARPVKIVSAPVADIIIRPGPCDIERGCPQVYNWQSREGEIIVEVKQLKFNEYYNNRKGSSKGGAWGAKVDVSSLEHMEPTWTLNDQPVTPVDGMIEIPFADYSSSDDKVSLKYTVSEDFDLRAGSSKQYRFRVIPDEGSLATEGFLNHSDGWQPGDGLEEHQSTHNLKGTGSSRGANALNNDYTYLGIYRPLDPPLGSAFNKYIERPRDYTQTLFDEVNKRIKDGSTLANADYRLNIGNHEVAPGTEIRSYLKINTKGYKADQVPVPQKIIFEDTWSADNLKPISPITLIAPNGEKYDGEVEVQWSLKRLRETSDEDWITLDPSQSPTPEMQSVRLTVVEPQPVGTEQGEEWTAYLDHRTADEYPTPLPAALPNFFTGHIGDMTLTKDAHVVPILPGTPSLETRIGASTSSVSRKGERVSWSIYSKIKNVPTVNETIKPRHKITIDACLKDLELKTDAWKIVDGSLKYGSGCGTDQTETGEFIVETNPEDYSFDGFYNGEDCLPSFRFSAKVLSVASSAVQVSEEFYLSEDDYNNEVTKVSDQSQLNVEEISTHTQFLETSTPIEEVENDLKFSMFVASAISKVSNGSETVVVLPGKGDDESFMQSLNERNDGDAQYPSSAPASSSFHGSYSLKDIHIDQDNSVEGITTLLCTQKQNPNLDPNQTNADWSENCGPDTTAFKIIQSAGNNSGISTINYTLETHDNKNRDKYLSWIGPTYIEGEPRIMAWPVNNKIVDSELHGRVFWDKDGDSSDWRSGDQPIKDLNVTLTSDDPSFEMTTQTDRYGKYEFLKLHKGNYRITISGYPTEGESSFFTENGTPKSINVDQTYAYDKRKDGAATPYAEISLPLDTKLKNINFGFFKKDPYVDVSKTEAKVENCVDGTCELTWFVTVKNDGNTPIAGGSLNDVTSSEVENVRVSSGVPEEPGSNIVRSSVINPNHLESNVLYLTDKGSVYCDAIGQKPNYESQSPSPFIDIASRHSGGSLFLSEDGTVYMNDRDCINRLSLFSHDEFKDSPSKFVSIHSSESEYFDFWLINEAGRIYRAHERGYPSYSLDTEAIDSDYLKDRKIVDVMDYLSEESSDPYDPYDPYDPSDPYDPYDPGSGPSNPHEENLTVYLLDSNNELFNLELPGETLERDVIKVSGSTRSIIFENGKIKRVFKDPINFLPTNMDDKRFTKSSEYDLGVRLDNNGKYWIPESVSKSSGNNFSISYAEARVTNENGENIEIQNLTDYCTGLDCYSAIIGSDGSMWVLDRSSYDYDYSDSRQSSFNLTSQNWRKIEKAGFKPAMVDPVVSPALETTNLGNGYTKRTYSLPTLQPNSSLTYAVKGKIRQSKTGFTVANQAWVTSNEISREDPETPAKPDFDAEDPEKSGKILNSETCSTIEDSEFAEKDGDACDQVFTSVPPTESPIGNVKGKIFWDKVNEDSKYDGDSSEENHNFGSVRVELYSTDNLDQPIAETLSKQDGSWEFNNIPSGENYVAKIYKPQSTDGDNTQNQSFWDWAPKTDECLSEDRSSCVLESGYTSEFSIPDNGTSSYVDVGLRLVNSSINVEKGRDRDGDFWTVEETESILTREDITSTPKTIEVPVVVVATNNGQEAMNRLSISDLTNSSENNPEKVSWDQCEIQGSEDVFQIVAEESENSTNWNLPEEWTLEPSQKISCRGTLTTSLTSEEHSDTATINGVGIKSGLSVSGESSYSARINEEGKPVPAITVTKQITDDEGNPVKTLEAEAGTTHKITFSFTNSGNEALTNMRWSDTTTHGEEMTDVSCDLQQNGTLQVGETITCTGNVHTGVMDFHRNTVRAFGVGEISGKAISAQDTITITTGGSSTLPSTGGSGVRIHGIMSLLLVLIASLIGSRRKNLIRRF